MYFCEDKYLNYALNKPNGKSSLSTLRQVFEGQFWEGGARVFVLGYFTPGNATNISEFPVAPAQMILDFFS